MKMKTTPPSPLLVAEISLWRCAALQNTLDLIKERQTEKSHSKLPTQNDVGKSLVLFLLFFFSWGAGRVLAPLTYPINHLQIHGLRCRRPGRLLGSERAIEIDGERVVGGRAGAG